MIPQTSKIRKRILGSSLSLPAHGKGWGKGNTFSCGAFCEAKYEIRRWRNPSSRTLCVHYGARSEGGQKFLVDTHSPTPLPFCPPERKLSKFSVRIFAEKSSDFVQDRQHCTIFSIFRLVLRLAASRLGAVWGQISEIFFVLRAKKI